MTFRDLANDFNKCPENLQSKLISRFVVDSYDFNNKGRIKNIFKTMYLNIVAEGIGGTKWHIQ